MSYVEREDESKKRVPLGRGDIRNQHVHIMCVVALWRCGVVHSNTIIEAIIASIIYTHTHLNSCWVNIQLSCQVNSDLCVPLCGVDHVFHNSSHPLHPPPWVDGATVRGCMGSV